ncbi:MAG: hypothetical protein M3P40_00550 [Actinomycetota bacterium]|nr:hypothetical protein [Actinomycetota bacterium]
MAYLVICIFFGIGGGIVGKVKGSSFWLWFLICAVLPGIGNVAALLHRVERNEFRRRCDDCGNVVPLHDAICTRCGAELDFPEVAIAPRSMAGEGGR